MRFMVRAMCSKCGACYPQVHYDDHPPYYTISIDGDERSTVRAALEPREEETERRVRGRPMSAVVGSRIVVRYDEGKRRLVGYPGVVAKCSHDKGTRLVLHVRFDGEPAELYEVEEDGEDDWEWEAEAGGSRHKRPRRR